MMMMVMMKLEAICSSETSVDFQRTTRRYIPGDINLRTEFLSSASWKAAEWNKKHYIKINFQDFCGVSWIKLSYHRVMLLISTES
jgi:hypothetical protein